MPLIENLSNHDEGSENVAKKINMRPFKLFRVNLDPFNFSNVDDLSRSEEGGRKIHHRMFAHPP